MAKEVYRKVREGIFLGPQHHGARSTEAIIDLVIRGAILINRFEICPSITACMCSLTAPICHVSVNGSAGWRIGQEALTKLYSRRSLRSASRSDRDSMVRSNAGELTFCASDRLSAFLLLGFYKYR